MTVGYANSLYLAASQPSESIERLAEDGATVRELLLALATALTRSSFAILREAID
jgi:hypothetical protein